MAATAAAVLCMGGTALAQSAGDIGGAPGDNATKVERPNAQKPPGSEGTRGDARSSPRDLQNTDMNGGGDSRMNERTNDRSNNRNQNDMAGHRDRGGMTNTDLDRDHQRMDRDNMGDRDRDRGAMGADRMRTRTTRITDVQRTRIKEVFRGRPGPRLTHVTFRIGVGARIPRTVRVVAVPPEIISIYPEWQGYSYFQTADEIVIIDPMSFAIVGVLPL
jgi:hypothetical protein